MSKIFRAPIAEHSFLDADAQTAIDDLLSWVPSSGQPRPICMRTDFFVSDADDPYLVRDGSWSLYVDSQSLRLRYPDMPRDLQSRFAHALAVINEDQDIQEHASCYPLPWKDPVFKLAVEERHLSLLIFTGGFGALVQEYIPTWMGLVPGRDYFSDGAPASTRAELLSVFIPEQTSDHDRLKALNTLAGLHPDLQVILAKHADDFEIDIARFDLADRL